jgi:hypothetical protein
LIYESKDGFYKKTYKYHITIGILSAVIVLLGVILTTSLFGSNSARREVDKLRGQLTEATDSNNAIRRELEDCRGEVESCQSRLGQCHFILEELGDTTRRSITTVRDCIDLVEEQRYYIACLSYYIDGGNSDELYQRIDDWLESEGVEFVK